MIKLVLLMNKLRKVLLFVISCANKFNFDYNSKSNITLLDSLPIKLSPNKNLNVNLLTQLSFMNKNQSKQN